MGKNEMLNAQGEYKEMEVQSLSLRASYSGIIVVLS